MTPHLPCGEMGAWSQWMSVEALSKNGGLVEARSKKKGGEAPISDYFLVFALATRHRASISLSSTSSSWYF
mgnify:CR=1 FL=1